MCRQLGACRLVHVLILQVITDPKHETLQPCLNPRGLHLFYVVHDAVLSAAETSLERCFHGLGFSGR